MQSYYIIVIVWVYPIKMNVIRYFLSFFGKRSHFQNDLFHILNKCDSNSNNNNNNNNNNSNKNQ